MIAEHPGPAVVEEVERDAGPRVVAALSIAMFLAAINYVAPTPFYPQIAKDLHTTVPLIGQIATIMILISAFLGLVTGPLTDRYGYHWPLVIGVSAVAIALGITAIAPSYAVLLLASLTGGMADALVFGLPLAIAGIMFSGRPRKRAFSITYGALSCGPVLGVPILTTIAAYSNWRIALMGAAGVAGLGAWYVHRAIPRDEARQHAPLRLREVLTAYEPFLRDRHMLRLFGSSACRAITWLGVLTYVGDYLKTEVGIGTRTVGAVYIVFGLGSALGSFTAARINFRSPRMTVCLMSVVCGVASGIALLVPNVWSVAPALCVMTFSSAIAGVAIVTILAAESPAGSGTTMVFNGSMLNFGAAAGAGLGGLMLALGSYRTMGIGLPIFALIAAALVWWPSATAQTELEPVRSTGD